MAAMHNTRPRRPGSAKGYTLIEVSVATAVSSMAMMAMMSIIVMASQFFKEAYWENKLRNDAALAMERVKPLLTSAYRLDANLPENRPIINGRKDRLDFRTPDDDGVAGEVEIYNLFRDQAGTGPNLVLGKNGTFTTLTRNVTDFHIETSEGAFVLMATIQTNFVGLKGKTLRKQFTLVTRVLPRNKGLGTY